MTNFPRLPINDYKGRTVGLEDKVMVYRNLNNDCLSIKKDGLIHGHARIVFLHDVQFFVSIVGNERVNEEGRKNVHAYVKGNIYYANEDNSFRSPEEIYEGLENSGWTRVYYNPYKVNTFVVFETFEPIYEAANAVIVMDRVYINNDN